ncbi:MAG TPA: class I SAM-dependent methyltransferase [Anaerolineae bacterium]|nr:class I SAM-dependent methyltransferase [Anaerolineae bacterium]
MKYVSCNVCGSDNWVVRYPSTLNGQRNPQVEAFRCTSAGYGEHTQIVQCYECKHIYANPTWEVADLMNAYETVEDDTYVEEREGRELTFRKHLQAVEDLIGPAAGRTLLDVGAYIGVFVEVANQAGWIATGIEPSSWAVEQAQARGLDVLEGTLDSAELHNRRFDLVTMWDVIEHVENPRQEIERAFALLKPGGMLVMHTMNVDSPIAKIMGSRWPWYMAMHVHFFSKKSLARLMRESGFEVKVVRTEGRYLRLGYLASRVEGINKTLGRITNRLIHKIGWESKPIPINFGDLFTIYGVRPINTTEQAAA